MRVFSELRKNWHHPKISNPLIRFIIILLAHRQSFWTLLQCMSLFVKWNRNLGCFFFLFLFCLAVLASDTSDVAFQKFTVGLILAPFQHHLVSFPEESRLFSHPVINRQTKETVRDLMQHLDEIQRGNHITVGHNKKAAVTIKEQTKGRKQTANTMQKCWHVKSMKNNVWCAGCSLKRA